MVFLRSKCKIDLDSQSLNHISLKKVKFTKFLGVIFDDQLKWTNQILYIKNKIAKGFDIILLESVIRIFRIFRIFTADGRYQIKRS